MTFDISKLAVAETTTIELDGPDGEKLTDGKGNVLSVTIYGPGSKAYQKAQGERNRAIMAQVRKGGKKMKDSEARELDAELLASCTISFNGFGYKDLTGFEMFKAAYMDASIGFIAEQINKELGDWENFIKRPSKS